jgi:molecular chaperone DnaK
MTVVGSKRLIGRPFHAQTVQDLRSHYAYRIVEGDEGEAAVDLGDGDIVSLEEVAGYLLREIRESASLLLSEPVTRAVITCPAFYTERQRDAVRIAGELAGFVVERVLSEPTAAALNHGLGRDFATRRVAVYDLGGGTFDVSILEVDGSVYEVLATGGDTFLGGVDFDATIAELAVERLVAAGHPDPRPDPAAVARIMEAAERAKLSLSEVPATILHVDRLRVGAHEPFDVALPIHRNEVDPRLTPLLDRTIELVEDTCRRAELRPDEVDDVLLVGGQTRYPAVAEAVTRVFGRSPRASVNPDEAVALGAAQYAVGMNTIDNVVLIDALPMSIGVGLPGDRFLPVLHRDQRLPADGSCLLPTSRKNQRSMDVWFFQGEGQRVSQTEPLGRLEISDLPPGPIGSTTVVVEVRVTEESVLEVRAKDRAGGRVFTSRFATRSTPEQLRAKLGLPDPPASGPRASAPSRAWSWLTRLFR